jgi:hypothetical protein
MGAGQATNLAIDMPNVAESSFVDPSFATERHLSNELLLQVMDNLSHF